MACKNPAKHITHICQLKLNQDFKKARAYSKKPMFYCGDCEAESNVEEVLCDPRKFKGMPGVLRWR